MMNKEPSGEIEFYNTQSTQTGDKKLTNLIAGKKAAKDILFAWSSNETWSRINCGDLTSFDELSLESQQNDVFAAVLQSGHISDWTSKNSRERPMRALARFDLLVLLFNFW
jgi:hypothetical protein